MRASIQAGRSRALTELLLLLLLQKDARAHKQPHWEARALLALGFLCQEEGEAEGAQDYLDATRRVVDKSGDRRGRLTAGGKDAAMVGVRGKVSPPLVRSNGEKVHA